MRGLCVGGDMVILFFSGPAVFATARKIQTCRRFLGNGQSSRLVQNYFSQIRVEVDYFEELTFLRFDEVLRLKRASERKKGWLTEEKTITNGIKGHY